MVFIESCFASRDLVGAGVRGGVCTEPDVEALGEGLLGRVTSLEFRGVPVSFEGTYMNGSASDIESSMCLRQNP